MKAILSVVPGSFDSLYIGDDNGNLLVTCKEDFNHFKRLTMGHTVLMGRKTADSLPRKLPGRISIAVSRELSTHPNVDCVLPLSLNQIYYCHFDEWHWRAVAGLESHDGRSKDIWVIGGAQLYEALIPICTEVWVTSYEGITVYLGSLGESFGTIAANSSFAKIDDSLLANFDSELVSTEPVTAKLYGVDKPIGLTMNIRKYTQKRFS